MSVLIRTPHALASEEDERVDAQRRIEADVTSFIRTLLAPDEFFVTAVVELEPPPSSTPAAQSDAATKSLPYSTLKLNVAQLRQGASVAATRAVKSLKLDLVFDERILESKRTIIQDAVRKRLAIDGQARVLEVGTARLVTPPVAASLAKEAEAAPAVDNGKQELESERMKIELAKKDLEIQRVRLENERQLGESASRVRELTEQVARARTPDPPPPAAATPPPTPPTPPPAPQEKPPEAQPVAKAAEPAATGALGTAERFQLLFLALSLAGALLIGLFLSSTAFRKGMTSLSEGFASIGNGLKEASAAAVEALKPKAAPKGNAAAEDDHDTGPGKGARPAEATAAAMPIDENARKQLEVFLAQVQEKVQILAKENSFALYREFIDLVETDASLSLAAALLLSLDETATAEIVKGLAPAHIERLRQQMSRPGALSEAKAMRAAALQEFYGRIAVEEFSGSPIMRLSDTAWITRMSSDELARFTLGLEDALRPAFLACLSPLRVQKMIESCSAEPDKRRLVEGLLAVGKVVESDIDALVQAIKAKKAAEAAAGARTLVDPGRYLGALVAGLGDEDQKLLLAEIDRDKAVKQTVERSYVPFSAVTRLPKEMLVEIFGERANEQIALLLFAAAAEVREVVLKSLPDIKAATVRDELKLLDAKTFYKKRNDRASALLQRQITAYLLKLREEGLLDTSAAETDANAASTALGGAA
jgi:flagellar motor switch protein FliG